MSFDPKTLTDIPDSERATLTDELGQETKRDALAHIEALAYRAARGDNEALNNLVAGTAASLALSILGHIGHVRADDPCGVELRAALAHLPGLDRIVILAGMQAAITAYASMPDSLRTTGRELCAAQGIATLVWEEVRAFTLTARDQRAHFGQRKSPGGADIFIVPPGPPKG